MTVLDMVDFYVGTLLLLAFIAVSILAVSWIYGMRTITRDFNFMLNTKLSVYWRLSWGLLCPIILPLLFLYVLFTQDGREPLPLGCHIIGWAMTVIGTTQNPRQLLLKQLVNLENLIWNVSGMLIVPAHILLSVCGDTETETNTLTSKVIATFRAGNIMEKIKMAFRPNSQWGPVDIQEKKDWQEYCSRTYL